MNKLSDCVIYNSLKESLYSGTLKLLKDVNSFKKFVIPSSFYDYRLKGLYTKKEPFIKAAIKAAESGKVKLVNFEDPIDGSKGLNNTLPQFPVWFGPDTEGKHKYVAYVNATVKSKYNRNDLTKEAVLLDIKENPLLALIRIGYAAIVVKEKDAEVTNSLPLQSTMAEIYSSIMSPVLDKMYPMRSIRGGYQVLNFLTSIFYLQTAAGYSVEKAVMTLSKNKNIDMVEIGNADHLIQDDKLEMKDFNQFVERLYEEFPFIKKNVFTVRSITSQYCLRYGTSAMFGIEHFQTLVSMVMDVLSAAAIYNDASLSQAIPKILLENVEKQLYIISGMV